MNYRVSIPRSKPCVSPETVDRMESADGNRRATGRYYKVNIGNRRWEPRLGYQLRERVNGKFKIITTQMSEDYARSWINGEN